MSQCWCFFVFFFNAQRGLVFGCVCLWIVSGVCWRCLKGSVCVSVLFVFFPVV